MTRFALLGGLLLLLSVSGAGADDKKEIPKDLVPFQGTWKVIKAEHNGTPLENVNLQFTFDGAKLEYLQNEKSTGPGTIALDAKKVPSEIDLLGEKAKSLGIYKFDNGKLILCYAKGTERPKTFDSSAVTGAYLLTLEKVEK